MSDLDKQDVTLGEIDGQLAHLLQNFPKVPTYALAKRIAKALLGPTARVWRKKTDDGQQVIEIGQQQGDNVFALGGGLTYEAALKSCAMTLGKLMAERKRLEATHGQGAGEAPGVGDGQTPLPPRPDAA